MKKFALITLLIFLIWLSCLVKFVVLIPTAPINSNIKTDGIVVVTGGAHRIEESITLFASNISDFLFISGVEYPNYLRELLNRRNIVGNVIFGTQAKSTYENAREVKGWVEKYNLNSIRLVTANYHMPRASLAIRQINPALKVVEHPVFPEAFNLNKLRLYPLTLKLLLLEYHKYMALRLSLLLGINI